MKLTPCNYEEINGLGYARTKWQNVLEEFVESDATCARVEDYSNKTATSALASIKNAIERYHMSNIGVRICDGEVYLIRLDKIK